MTSAARLLETVKGRGDRKSIVAAFSDIDIENQFIKWKNSQPPIVYDVSVNPKGCFYWYWSCLVSLACFYNLIFITLIVYEDVRDGFYSQWITGNVICDVIYLVDMLFQSRVCFYEHGCKVSDISETRMNYIANRHFLIDIISILPTDLFLLLQFDASLFSKGPPNLAVGNPYLIFLTYLIKLPSLDRRIEIYRLNRLLKCYRLFEVFDLAQGRLKQVIISLLKIIISCTLIFHWNACAFYVISKYSDTKSWNDVNATFDDDEFWPWPYMPDKITDVHFSDCSHFEQTCDYRQILIDEEREAHLLDLWRYWKDKSVIIEFSTFTKAYVLSMYWSALTMTTLGEQPSPNETLQTVFEILDTVVGMVLFAGIMGSVGDLVAKANKVKADWQQRMDGLKQFMTYRNLSVEFQQRVLKYCEHEMAKQEKITEVEMRSNLTPKLYTRINKYMQWSILTKSQIFEGCELPFLKDLVAYLEPRDFGPGDVISAIGELNKEMFIVASGCLRITDQNAMTLKTFGEGEVLEDQTLVWFANNRYRNRRKHDVVSVGYSQVYILFRDDLLFVLKDYPDCREKIRTHAERLQTEAGELCDEVMMTDVDEFEGTTLEERLIAMRGVLYVLENSINENYEKFKKSSNHFKHRIAVLERFCHDLVI